MSHKVELRNYLSAAGDEQFSDWSDDSPFRQIDKAKNELDDVLNKARSLYTFLDDTCQITGLDVSRTSAATQVELVTDALAAAQTKIAALTFPALSVAWPTDKAAVSDLTEYVAPVEPTPEDSPAVSGAE